MSAHLLIAFLAAADPQPLADRVDAHIDAKLASSKAVAAPLADDAEFLRRASLDLTGRIPTPAEVHAFLADTTPDKRAKLIDDLLDSPRSAAHLAAVWRAFLIPEAGTDEIAGFLRPGFEAWLRDQFRANARYDTLVRDLLTTPMSANPRDPTPVFRTPTEPNPLAFFAAKEAKPENLAASVSRAFLGVQLECAQCHDHPFASWSRDQFWQQAAFFAGLGRQGNGATRLSEDATQRAIKVAGTSRTVSTAFLDGTEPTADASPRAALAAWVTSPGNPYFAKATANRVWGQLFGTGLVDPVDDFRDDVPPSHPELLAELSRAFTAFGFDLRHLFRAVCRTKAYQRTSRQTHASQADPRLFARAAVRGLTGEQFFDSLARATGHREEVSKTAAMDRRRDTPRERFLVQFAASGTAAAPATSVPQALALMNGTFVNNATTFGNCDSFAAVRDLPGLDAAGRVEALYLLTLSRKPTDAERDRVLRYLDAGGTDAANDRLADAFWVLLNSAEFRFNH